PPPNPAVHLISAMRQILRRSLVRSTPSSPINKTSREIHGSGLARCWIPDMMDTRHNFNQKCQCYIAGNVLYLAG
ncbi:hypothetical protein A2U01_0042122, partial [Trifolium medium]|nr:hypothetical protein [Trifolium medium]